MHELKNIYNNNKKFKKKKTRISFKYKIELSIKYNVLNNKSIHITFFIIVDII